MKRVPAVEVVDLPFGPASPVVTGENSLVFVIDGLLLCERPIGSVRSAEIVGPGDLLPHPAEANDPTSPRATWTCLTNARLAVVDVADAARTVAWPRISARLLADVEAQLHRASQATAIAHLPRVADRVHATLWRLAERFGRVTPEGVKLRLDLTHRTIGTLVGARRPTVSIALRCLDETGAVVRTADGWLLAPEPPAALLATTAATRRRVAPGVGATSLDIARHASVTG